MFTASNLPWEISQVSRKNRRLYFELFFGTITMDPAVEALLNVYSDSRPEKPNVKGFSAIASVILDKEGRPLEEEETASVSSFAWGVPVALEGDLRKLAAWPDHEFLADIDHTVVIRGWLQPAVGGELLEGLREAAGLGLRNRGGSRRIRSR